MNGKTRPLRYFPGKRLESYARKLQLFSFNISVERIIGEVANVGKI
jgi:hypothetical protein